MLEFIVANLPMVICFLVGIGLMVLECFLPGFGLPGISGVVLEVISVAMAWNNHGPLAALGMTLIVLSVIALVISITLKSISSGKLSKSPIVLNHRESTEEGYRSSDDQQVFLGKEGVTTTVLRPTGMAEFDGVKLNVVSEGEFIQLNTPVRIIEVEGSRILVRAI